MPRQIYLLAFPVSKATKMNGGRAHWAIFVPTIDSSTKGKVIQVTGNPFMGFTLDFKRNYDIENDSRAHHMLTLALIDDKHISDGAIYGDGGSSTDSNALDILEAEAKELDPLGVSVEPLNPLVVWHLIFGAMFVIQC